jgi:dTDP-4-amino-4,6-dideoxygalactose transaminase
VVHHQLLVIDIMRIGRTLPPAAAPLGVADLWWGLRGLAGAASALRKLHAELRDQFGARHVFLVSSGTAALTVTLRALAASSRRTGVVIPGYTCFTVPGAVVHAGLRPVPCDIDASTFDFDHTRLAEAIDGDTLCVVAHHLFGVPSDIGSIRALCHSRGIAVIEDAAQGMGGMSKDGPLGTLGDVAILSFGRGKSVTACGGGAILTNSDHVASAIGPQLASLPAPSPGRMLLDLLRAVLMAIFIRPQLYWIPAALPFLRLGETVFPTQVSIGRLSGVHAGLLHHWRRRLDESNAHRAAVAAAIGRQLDVAPRMASSVPYLRLPIVASSADEKERLCADSKRLGLGLSGAYPSAVDEIPELRQRAPGVRCPQARSVADHLLTVPVHHWLTTRDVRALATFVRSTVRSSHPVRALPHAS